MPNGDAASAGPDAGGCACDDLVICEVMAAALARTSWRGLRVEWERRPARDELVVRARPVERR